MFWVIKKVFIQQVGETRYIIFPLKKKKKKR